MDAGQAARVAPASSVFTASSTLPRVAARLGRPAARTPGTPSDLVLSPPAPPGGLPGALSPPSPSGSRPPVCKALR